MKFYKLILCSYKAVIFLLSQDTKTWAISMKTVASNSMSQKFWRFAWECESFSWSPSHMRLLEI